MHSEIKDYVRLGLRHKYGICGWTMEIECQQLVEEQGEKLPLLNEKINSFLSNLLMEKIEEIDDFFKTSSDMLLYMYLTTNEDRNKE
jgi:hypothetical protein